MAVAGAAVGVTEYAMRRKDGSQFPALVRSTRILQDGEPAGLHGVIIDISERKRTEQELRESKNLFEKVFESQRDALFILDASVPAKISDCNPAAAEVFGCNRQEMTGITTR